MRPPTKAADLLAAVAVAVQRLRGCDTTDEGGAADDLLALLRSDPIAVELLLRNSGALFFMTLDALVETICNTEGAVRHDVSEHLCAVCVVAIDLVAAVAARGGEAEASPSTASSSSDDPPLALAARSPPPQPSPALEELRSAARIPSVGLAVSVLLDAGSGRVVRDRACQLGALNALRSLVRCVGHDGSSSSDGGPSTLWNFLPGISTELVRIALTPRVNQPSAVVVAAIETWGVTISFAVGDRACAALLPRKRGLAERLQSLAADHLAAGVVGAVGAVEAEVDAADASEDGARWSWSGVRRVARKLEEMLRRLLAPSWDRGAREARHSQTLTVMRERVLSGWKVRAAIVRLAHHLAMLCPTTLAGAMPLFGEAIATMLVDQQPLVAELAGKALREFRGALFRDGGDDEALLAALESRAVETLLALSKVSHASDEIVLCSALRRATGLVRLLGGSFLDGAVAAEADGIAQSLCGALELTAPIAATLSVAPVRHFEGAESATTLCAERRLGLHHAFATDPRTAEAARSLCRCLGASSVCAAALVDAALSIFQRSRRRNAAEAIVLMREVLVGAALSTCSGGDGAETPSPGAPLVASVTMRALEEIVALDAWERPGGAHVEEKEEEEEEARCTDASSRRRDVLITVLAADVVGSMAETLDMIGAPTVPLLQRALFPLTCKAGSAHPLIRRAAQHSLRRLALSRDGGGVGGDALRTDARPVAALLLENLDYLVDTLVLRLQQISRESCSDEIVAGRLENVAGVAAVLWGQAIDLVPNCSAPVEETATATRTPAQFRALLRDAARAVLASLDGLEGGDASNRAKGRASHRAYSQEALLSVMLAIAQGESAAAPTLQQQPRGGVESSPPAAAAAAAAAEEKIECVSKLLCGLSRAAPFERSSVELLAECLASERAVMPNESDVDDAFAEWGGGDNAVDGAAGEDAIPASMKPHVQVFRRGQVAVDLGDKCVYFLSSSTPRSRMLSLAVVEHVVLALGGAAAHAKHEQAREWHRNALLPLVHRIWPAMLPRLSDSSVAVRLRAYGVFAAIVRSAGSFMAGRFHKGAWPAMRSQLDKAVRARRSHGPVSLVLRSRPLMAASERTAAPSKAPPFMMRARGTTTKGDDAGAAEVTAVSTTPLSRRRGGAKTMALRAQLALLECLVLVCRVDGIVRAGSDAAMAMSLACVGLVVQSDDRKVRSAAAAFSSSSSSSGGIKDAAEAVLAALASIDYDCVWGALRSARLHEQQRCAAKSRRCARGITLARASPSSSLPQRELDAVLRRIEMTQRETWV